jgi:hypothetical protein
VSILAYQEDNFLEEKKGRLQSPSSLLVWLWYARKAAFLIPRKRLISHCGLSVLAVGGNLWSLPHYYLWNHSTRANVLITCHQLNKTKKFSSSSHWPHLRCQWLPCWAAQAWDIPTIL